MRDNKQPAGTFLLADDDGHIDELAVALALSGARRVGLTRTERAEAAARLLAEGADLAHIRYRLGLGPHAARETVEAARRPLQGAGVSGG